MDAKSMDGQAAQLFQEILDQMKELDNRAGSIPKRILQDKAFIRELALRSVLQHGTPVFSVVVDYRKTLEQLISETFELKVSKVLQNTAKLEIGRQTVTRKLGLVKYADILSGKYKSAGIRDQFALGFHFPEVQQIVPVATCESTYMIHRSYKDRTHFPVLNKPDALFRFILLPEPLEPPTMFLAVLP